MSLDSPDDDLTGFRAAIPGCGEPSSLGSFEIRIRPYAENVTPRPWTSTATDAAMVFQQTRLWSGAAGGPRNHAGRAEPGLISLTLPAQRVLAGRSEGLESVLRQTWPNGQLNLPPNNEISRA